MSLISGRNRIMDEQDEYELLVDTERSQFVEAYNSEDLGKAQSPVVADLVKRVLEKEATKMEKEQKGTVELKVIPADNGKQSEEKIKEALLNKTQMTLQETMTLGAVLYKSRFFADIQSDHQAVAKILAGRELGLGPMVSLSKVFVVGGKIAIQAEVMADMIKRGNKYDYRVIEITNEKCLLHFFENGKKVGESIFTIADAQKADLTKGTNWHKYPRNMLFSRALSNGARWYCPDALHSCYTYDEMGLEVDSGGTVIPQNTGITIEAETVPQTKQVEKTEMTRSEKMDEIKEKYGVEKMKEVKNSLKIKGKLADVSKEIWDKYVMELERGKK